MNTKIAFLIVFCLINIAQGSLMTYFVSILNIIEKLYQIPSKTAGALMSSSEIGQIVGSIIITLYANNKNKSRWLAVGTFMVAVASLIATLPHFFFDSRSRTTSIDSEIHIYNPLANLSRYKLDLVMKNLICENSIVKSTIPMNMTPEISELSETKIPDDYEKSDTTVVLTLFSTSLILIGLGSATITTLGTPIIDEIVSKLESPLYLGMTIGLRIFGPALGFVLGSYTVKLNLNHESIDQLVAQDSKIYGFPIRSLLKDSDTGHVGAWWLGFIIVGVPVLTLVWPLYKLTKFQLNLISRKDEKLSIQNTTPDYQSITSNSPALDQSEDKEPVQPLVSGPTKQKLVSFMKYLNRRSTHGKVSCIKKINSIDNNRSKQNRDVAVIYPADKKNKSSSVDSRMYSSGVQVACDDIFVEVNLFSRRAVSKRLMKNRLFILRVFSQVLHILPVAGFFTFLPKYLNEQFLIDQSTSNSISGLAGIMFIGIGAFISGLVIRLFNFQTKVISLWVSICALSYVIGMILLMNVGCDSGTLVSMSPPDHIVCGKECICQGSVYTPICRNNITYLSPCLAGCSQYKILEDVVQVTNCSCGSISDFPETSHTQEFTLGNCKKNCPNLKWYIVIFAITAFIHGTQEVCATLLNLRSVDKDDCTFALGIINLATAILGSIPCAVLFGIVVDHSCIKWNTINETGACMAYNNETFRLNLHGTAAVIMIFAFIIDLITIKYAKHVNLYPKDSEQTT